MPPAANCLANLPTNPNWRKVNPAELAPLVLALTSDTATQPELYDVADSILAQKISQIEGMGTINEGGSARPAVRAEVNPFLLSKLGIGFDQVATALNAANAHSPKGQISTGNRSFLLNDNDQLYHASEYAPLIVAYNNGAPVRLSDISYGSGRLRGRAQRGKREWQAYRADLRAPAAPSEHGRTCRSHQGHAPVSERFDSAFDPHQHRPGPHHDHPHVGA